MSNKKMMAIVASTALAACLGLAGCGGNQPAPESAAPTSAPSSATATNSATDSVAPDSTAASTSSTTSDTSSATSATASYIGDQAAVDAALANAGFTRGDVTELEVELDLDDPSGHYDVSFKQGGMEYDYDIDATTGAILTSTSETEN